MGISAFVVDWYGDREPFIDRSYALMQAAAQKNKFQVAMMYDETNEEDGSDRRSYRGFHDVSRHVSFGERTGAPGVSHLRGPARDLHFPQGKAHGLG